jgi:glucose/arabinose dehydrogenase
MLYVATGDTEDRPLAQDPESLAGKILRITADGLPAPDNPIPDSPVYSSGHRNVQGLAWDGRGRLFATELGDHAFDELNLIEAGGDYGWPAVEGVGNDPRFIDPVATLVPSQGSPSGIAIIGDRAYLACLRGRRLASVALDGSGQIDLLADEYGRLRTVQVGPEGDLWITTSNRDGRLRERPDTDDDRVLRVTLGPAESTRDAVQ